MYIVTPPCNLGGWGCKITDESQSFLVSNPIFWGVAVCLEATEGCASVKGTQTRSVARFICVPFVACL